MDTYTVFRQQKLFSQQCESYQLGNLPTGDLSNVVLQYMISMYARIQIRNNCVLVKKKYIINIIIQTDK